MFVLAHLSDLHMALQPRSSALIGKRGLGYLNWHRKRKHIHRPELLDDITRDLKGGRFDHVVVTGDLVNLSLQSEYRLARIWLEALGLPRDVTVVPGNHDIYVRGVEQSPAEFWGDYMTGDDGIHRFPFLRRRGDVALIALSSGVSTGPFLATGRIGKNQLARLAEVLEQTDGMFRIVLIHHPPEIPLKRFLRRLIDAASLRRVLAEKGAELLLHGHDHRRAVTWLNGRRGRLIPAVGVPSASARAHGEENEAGYNIFRIERNAGHWRCEMTARERSAGGIRDVAKRTLP